MLLIACLSLPSTVAAQGKPVTCSTIITNDEVVKAVGAKMDDMGDETVRRAGTTECSWMLRGPLRTVFVSFEDMSAVKESTAGTPDKHFEFLVANAEETRKGKRAVLSGIGRNAALVASGYDKDAFQVIVQRPDGVASITTMGLSKAQVTEVAKAVRLECHGRIPRGLHRHHQDRQRQRHRDVS
jgi:hypothetical protein